MGASRIQLEKLKIRGGLCTRVCTILNNNSLSVAAAKALPTKALRDLGLSESEVLQLREHGERPQENQ